MHDAKLVWITPDAEKLIGKIARVSNPANEDNPNVVGLLKYLIKHKHWSPFEMASMCLEIQTTRAISPQILRHRSFSFQEFSQRYAEPETMGYPFEVKETRLQDTKNRQNSIETNNVQLQQRWAAQQARVIGAASSAYAWAVDNGIAKEQARAVLPEGITKSRLYMNGTVRSWIHYVELRTTVGTQKEHMDIAHACAEVIADIFPMAEELISD